MISLKTRFKIHYLPMLIVGIIFSFIFYGFREPALSVIPFITLVSGYIGIVFLAISLLLGPVNLMLKRRNPVSTYIRRDIGIFGGILAVVHSVVGLFVHFTGRPWLYFIEEGGAIRLGYFGLANYIGLFGTLIIILLLAISNNYSLRKLKAIKWKNLQRFTYLMFVFALLHSVFYRLNPSKEDFVWYFYFPMFLVVLIVQVIGMKLKIGKLKDFDNKKY